MAGIGQTGSMIDKITAVFIVVRFFVAVKVVVHLFGGKVPRSRQFAVFFCSGAGVGSENVEQTSKLRSCFF
jgi:hypothetical protein